MYFTRNLLPSNEGRYEIIGTRLGDRGFWIFKRTVVEEYILGFLSVSKDEDYISVAIENELEEPVGTILFDGNSDTPFDQYNHTLGTSENYPFEFLNSIMWKSTSKVKIE